MNAKPARRLAARMLLGEAPPDLGESSSLRGVGDRGGLVSTPISRDGEGVFSAIVDDALLVAADEFALRLKVPCS